MSDFRTTEGKPFYLVSYFEGGKVFHGLKKDRLNDIPRNLLKAGDFAIVKNRKGKNETFVWTGDCFIATDNFKNQWDLENTLGDVEEVENEEIVNKNKKENENMKTETEDIKFVTSNSDSKDSKEDIKKSFAFFNMNSEEMKKYYPTLGDMYKKCWVENLHYKLDECKVSFINNSDKQLSARINLSFNSETYGSAGSIKFTILIRDFRSWIDGKYVKTGYTSKMELETETHYDITLIRLIDATCDLLDDYFKDCNLEDEKDVSKIMGFLKLFD